MLSNAQGLGFRYIARVEVGRDYMDALGIEAHIVTVLAFSGYGARERGTGVFICVCACLCGLVCVCQHACA